MTVLHEHALLDRVTTLRHENVAKKCSTTEGAQIMVWKVTSHYSYALGHDGAYLLKNTRRGKNQPLSHAAEYFVRIQETCMYLLISKFKAS